MNKRLKIVCWITAAAILLLAVLLIVSCIRIYLADATPFTRERIAEAFRRIAFPLSLCVILAIAGAFIGSERACKIQPVRQSRDQLMRQTWKWEFAYEEQRGSIRRERRFRMFLLLAAGVISAAAAALTVFYFLDPAHFTIANLTQDVLRSLLIAAVSGGSILVVVYAYDRLYCASVERELQIWRKVPINGEKPANEKQNSKAILIVRGILLTVAAVMILLGINNGGVAAVLGKAIRICTECIGLG